MLLHLLPVEKVKNQERPRTKTRCDWRLQENTISRRFKELGLDSPSEMEKKKQIER